MSTADPIAEARRILTPRVSAPNWWAALFATGLLATATVLLAGAIILGPGFSVAG